MIPSRLLLPHLAMEAIGNLLAAGQRSLLALIGIIIGTAAVIAMVNVGDNASRESLRQFEAMGTDLVVVQNGLFGSGGIGLGLAPEELEELPTTLPSVTMVSPLVIAATNLGRGQGLQAVLVGATANFAPAAHLALSEGRFISRFDHLDTFVVIGHRIAATIASTPLRIGDQIRIRDYIFTVIGIVEEMAYNPMMPFDVNTMVAMPIGAMRRVADSSVPSTLLVRTTPNIDPMTATAELVARLREMRHGKPVQAQSAQQLIEGMRKQAQLLSALLAAIGAISLTVGGVGVMNVMLMNVAERRREIGLRMALGARVSHIRTMFLIEAATLSLAGGLAGTLLGLLSAFVFARMSDWQYHLTLEALPLGALISIAVGLFFGAYPASAAAAVDPIESLRTE